MRLCVSFIFCKKKNGGSLIFPSDRMFEFQNGEIEFYCCFGVSRLQIVFENFGNWVTVDVAT